MTKFAAAEALWHAVLAYGGFGLLVAVAFLGYGLPRVTPGARGAYAFRPLLLPGLVLLWPLVLWRWAVLARGRQAAGLGRHYARTQRVVWVALAVLLPLLLVAALALRQSGPIEAAPVRLVP
jgi:hypothetical protein